MRVADRCQGCASLADGGRRRSVGMALSRNLPQDIRYGVHMLGFSITSRDVNCILGSRAPYIAHTPARNRRARQCAYHANGNAAGPSPVRRAPLKGTEPGAAQPFILTPCRARDDLTVAA